MHLPIGTLLQGGRYEILRFISSGGFGCTYEARDTKFKSRVKSVAIKEFFVNDLCNRDIQTNRVVVGTLSKKGLYEKLRKKFLDEADALFEFEHPNIVRVTDTFEENNTAYYVMEYINGSSLAKVVEKNGALSEREALDYIRQVADALAYVHSCNRLHLDVKPQNIMIDHNGKAVLIDFGVSKQYDEVSGENTSTLIGFTPGYAPIEQSGSTLIKFDEACDIYALGATLYKVLTGVTPAAATLRAGDKSFKELNFPSALSLPTRNAIDKAMQISRNDRPQCIAEFLALLSDNSALVAEDITVEDEVPHDGKTTPENYDSGETTIYFGRFIPDESTAKVSTFVTDEKIKWLDFVQFCDNNKLSFKRRKVLSYFKDISGLIYVLTIIMLMSNFMCIIYDEGSRGVLMGLWCVICKVLGIAEYIGSNYEYDGIGITTLVFLGFSVLLVPFMYCTDTRQFLDIQDTASPFKITRSKKGLLGITKWRKKRSSLLLDMKYDNIWAVNYDTFICGRGGLYGVYNATKKEMLVPVEHESIKVDGDRILATKGYNVSVYTDRDGVVE